jgi:uncharacterized protein YhfF
MPTFAPAQPLRTGPAQLGYRRYRSPRSLKTWKITSKPVPERYQHLRTFAFGDSPGLADELLELVIRGIKTATCSTEDEPNTSAPGERWVVLDGRGEPRCVIESTEVRYLRFNEIDAAFAYDEGEGDRSLAYWRSAHRAYFGRLGRFSEDMMLMCERFRLVEFFCDLPHTEP